MDAYTVETDSEEGTGAVGERLAAAVRAGDLVLLYGELGAGKTAFVRGLARGLGAAPDEVSSPTFTLIQPYRTSGGLLFHVDLYRLTPVETEDLGLDELLADGGIVAIEWPGRWHGRPVAAFEVRIEDLGGDRRAVTVIPAAARRI